MCHNVMRCTQILIYNIRDVPTDHLLSLSLSLSLSLCVCVIYARAHAHMCAFFFARRFRRRVRQNLSSAQLGDSPPQTLVLFPERANDIVLLSREKDHFFAHLLDF